MIGRLAVAALVLVAVLVVEATPAGACSCGGTVQPAHMTGENDAAFVGRVREAPDSSFLTGSNDPVAWVFDVEEVYIGDIGPQINVATPAAGPSCGLSDDLEVGDRLALAVTWTDQMMGGDLGQPRWTSNSCSVAGASAFEGSVKPHPPDQAIGPGPRAPNESAKLPRYSVGALAGGALLVVAGVGLLVNRRRRNVRPAN